MEPEAMHDSSRQTYYKPVQAGLLQAFCLFIQDLWSGLMGRIAQPALAHRRHAGPAGSKRWSSTQLARAPGRLKPMSHLQFARQQKNTAGQTGLELKRSELEDMVRDGICLDGTYLAFADLTYAFLSNGRFRGANLAGANLSRAIIIGGNFMDASLRNACLVSADLRHCNFHYADLSGANLRGANLSGADLSGANLWGADLYGANLEGALLAGANWNPPN
jgi:uncharacterized protein YjbI with pentapeptide repeats